MEFKAKIEMLSGLQSRSFTPEDGSAPQLIEYVEVVLNNGLERISAESYSGNQAKAFLARGLRVGDTVVAQLITWCKKRKTTDGRFFFANVTKIMSMEKEFDLYSGSNA